MDYTRGLLRQQPIAQDTNAPNPAQLPYQTTVDQLLRTVDSLQRRSEALLQENTRLKDYHRACRRLMSNQVQNLLHEKRTLEDRNRCLANENLGLQNLLQQRTQDAGAVGPEPNRAETGQGPSECHPSEASSAPSGALSDADHIDGQGLVVEGSETGAVSDPVTEVERNDARQVSTTQAQEDEMPDPSRPRRASSNGDQTAQHWNIMLRDEIQQLAATNEQLESRNEALNKEKEILNRNNLALAAQNEKLMQQQEAFLNRAPLMQNEALAANRRRSTSL